MHLHDHLPHYLVEANANRINQDGESYFEVDAGTFVRATPEQAWRVLTDYERLVDFVPDLVASTVVSRGAREAIVEQRSETSYLFISHTIHMRLRIEERPFTSIDAALIEGDMKHYTAHWELTPAAQDGMTGSRIRFSGAMEPVFYLPPLLGRSIVQVNVKKMVEAVVTEIERSAH